MNTIIGIDAKRIVRNGTGLGSYGRTLVNDLSASGDCLLRLYAPDKGRDDLRRQILMRPNVEFCFAPDSHIPFYRQWWRSRGVVSCLSHDGVQLYHGLSGELPIGISKSGVKSVVTIHDLIFLRHPEFYNWADTKIYAWKFRKTISEADHIIAISDCTKRDIIELGNVDERKISVIYQSFSPRFKTAAADGTLKHNLPQRFILGVGTIERRKNMLLALKALHYLPDDVSLVLVGRHTPYSDELSRYATANGLTPRLMMLHDVGDDELPVLYARAEAFVGESLATAVGGGLAFVVVVLAYLYPLQFTIDVADIERGASVGLREVLVDGNAQDLRAEIGHLPFLDTCPSGALLQGGRPMSGALDGNLNDSALHIGFNTACSNVFIDFDNGSDVSAIVAVPIILTGSDAEAEAAHQRGHQHSFKFEFNIHYLIYINRLIIIYA